MWKNEKWGANIITGELILKIRVKHLMLGTNIKKWVPLSGLLKPKFLDMSMHRSMVIRDQLADL